jgi:uncharacterized protein (DUF433 family)
MRGLERITFDPQIMAGQACIRGMRIPVSLVVNLVAHGAQTAEILAEYPDLEPQDIQQALEYAASSPFPWRPRREVPGRYGRLASDGRLAL